MRLSPASAPRYFDTVTYLRRGWGIGTMKRRRIETLEQAEAVLVELGAPARLVRHGWLVLEAADALLGRLAELLCRSTERNRPHIGRCEPFVGIGHEDRRANREPRSRAPTGTPAVQ